jgi:hypothetical protein
MLQNAITFVVGVAPLQIMAQVVDQLEQSLEVAFDSSFDLHH